MMTKLHINLFLFSLNVSYRHQVKNKLALNGKYENYRSDIVHPIKAERLERILHSVIRR